MRSFLRLLPAAVLIAFGIILSTAFPPVAHAQTGSISGTVYEPDGTTPVAFTMVQLFYSTGFYVTDTFTDANGEYVFTALEDDSYKVRVDMFGYPDEWYQDRPTFGAADVITISGGSTLTGIDIILDEGVSVSGTVTESNGVTPIEFAGVSFYDLSNIYQGQAFTSETGDYEIYLRPGSYKAYASASGYQQEYYLNQPNFSAGNIITVTAGTPVSGIDFTLSTGGVIRGTVYAPDGVTPVQNAVIYPYYNNAYQIGICTNSDGEYTIQGLPLGVPIKLLLEGNTACGMTPLPYYDKFYDNVFTFSEATNLFLSEAAPELNGIDFVFDNVSGGISGTVYQPDGVTPISGAGVTLLTSSGAFFTSTTTDGSGSYAINLPVGSYLVRFAAAGYPAEYYDDEPLFANADVVTVGSSMVTGIDAVMNTGGTISGVVTNTGGSPLGVTITVYDAATDQVVATTGSNFMTGFYSVTVLPGDYKIGTTFALSYINEYHNNQTLLSNADVVTVGAGASISIDFELAAAGYVDGTVYDYDGVTPLQNVRVSAYAPGYEFGYACTNASGAYRVFSVPLDVPVAIFISGDQDCTGANPAYDTEYYDDKPSPGLADTITLTSGSPNIAGINFVVNYAGGTPTPSPTPPPTDTATPTSTPAVTATYTPTPTATFNPAGGAIFGTVYQPDGVTPASSAEITLYRDFDMFMPYQTTLTSASGEFSFTLLPDGYYQIRVNSFSHPIEYYQDQINAFAATAIEIAGGNAETITINLDAGSLVIGEITDYNTGSPIADATVTFMPSDSPGGMLFFQTTTDSFGGYTIYLRPGSYYMNAGGPDHVNLWYPGVFSVANATPVVVTADDSVTGIDVALPGIGVISGTVRDSFGSDIISSEVRLYLAATGERITGTCGDWSSGQYEIAYVPIGLPVIVRAIGGSDCGGPGGFVSEYWQESATFAGATPITLTTGSPAQSGIDFTLDPDPGTSGISGTVYLPDGVTPRENAQVQLLTASFNLVDSTFTDALGQYAFSSQFSGDYVIYVTDSLYPGEYYQDAVSIGSATIVTLLPDSTVTGINVVLDAYGTISGTLTDVITSAPVPFADITFFDAGGFAVFGVQSDMDGQYSASLRPGTYRVAAQSFAYQTQFYDNAPSLNSATPIVVTVSSSFTANMQLTPRPVVTGTVYDDSMNPLADASVYLYDQFGSEIIFTCTGFDGTYTLSLPQYETDYYVATNGQDGSCAFPTGIVQLEYWQESPDFAGATPIRATLSSPIVSGISFTLANTPASISGAVYDDNTLDPISGATVRLWSNNAPVVVLATTTTDSSGNFIFSDVTPGTYRVSGLAAGYAEEFYANADEWFYAAPVSAFAGSNTSGITLYLEPGGTISGTVLSNAAGNPPVVDRTVTIRDAITSNIAASLITDVNGQYSVNLRPGSYTLRAEGLGFVGEYFDNQPSTPDVVSLSAGGSIVADFFLDPLGTVSGNVYDESGISPIGGIAVNALRQDNLLALGGACTDSGGAYEIYDLPLNIPIIIRAEAPEFGCGTTGYDTEYYLNSPDAAGAAPLTFTLSTPVINGISFTLSGGSAGSGTITGTIYDADGVTPIGGAFVGVQEKTTFDFYFTSTDGNGFYSIDVPAGTYTVNASAGGNVLTYYDGTPDFSSAADVIVTAGNTTANISITLPLAGSILTTVYAADGVTPLDDVRVQLLDPITQLDQWTGCSNSDGQVFFSGLPLDTSYIVVVPGVDCFGDTTLYNQEYWQESSTFAGATTITISLANRDVTGVTFTLDLFGAEPTATPTLTFTPEPTSTPTDEPTATFTPEPTNTPTDEPTATFTPEPTSTPTDEPTATFTPEPTNTPTDEPTATF
ncbi:hypothetical protein FBR02_14770, partial [Anaerolineae bacterium CFX9]|nr:hypothetical protein [Anaerolineae bacterium CFX9]